MLVKIHAGEIFSGCGAQTFSETIGDVSIILCSTMTQSGLPAMFALPIRRYGAAGCETINNPPPWLIDRPSNRTVTRQADGSRRGRPEILHPCQQIKIF
jgi:hypothetical protein